MTSATRVSPDDVRRRMGSGSRPLLVCAYDDAEKCRQVHLDGAIDMAELQARLPALSKEAEIVFYCA